MDKLKVIQASIAAVHANDWNPNRMNERVAQATRESIQEHGFVDPILCRPHPSIDGEWEIIDGEHRRNEAEDAGYSTVPIIVIPATDQQAKKLTIILNETRGDADPVDLGTLLSELAEQMSMDDLLRGLPFGKVELENLLTLGKTEWDTFGGEAPEPPESDGWGHLHLSLPPDVLPLWLRALDRYFAEAQRPDSDAVAGGMLVEALVADYLAQ